MLWMTHAVEGFSEIYGRRSGNEVRTSGKGKDPGGEFLERGSYSEISEDACSFLLERSYENGLSLNPFVSFSGCTRCAERRLMGGRTAESRVWIEDLATCDRPAWPLAWS
jgi:hypothetical protein